MLTLAELCDWNKEKFVEIADFIVNRILLCETPEGNQRQRTMKELNHYVLSLFNAGNSLQPLTREELCNEWLPNAKSPYLIYKLLGHDGKEIYKEEKDNSRSTLSAKPKRAI